MKINPKERRYPRELNRLNQIEPVRKPFHNCTVRFTDIPFPPLLKLHSRAEAKQ